jgi:uncharacterized protein
VTVEHIPHHHRFVVRLPEGEAILAYRDAGPDLLDIRSTYVPPASRGRGTGGLLVRAALDHARATGRRVIPSCWYVGTWVREHPEYHDLLAG